VSDPTVIYSDNLSSIQLAKKPIFHARMKHIEVHYHFVRERVLSGEVELQHVSTDRHTADIFTKPLGLDKLRKFSGALGLRHLHMPNLRGRNDLEGFRRKYDGQEASAPTGAKQPTTTRFVGGRLHPEDQRDLRILGVG
jgi:hypothetical protein